MELTQLDIERIVREVIARLKAEAPNHPKTSGRGGVCRSDEGPSGVRKGDTIHCNQRVVTLATLDGKLDGVRRFIARRGAVITPAVKDLFRDRGIAWSHDGDGSADGSSPFRN